MKQAEQLKQQKHGAALRSKEARFGLTILAALCMIVAAAFYFAVPLTAAGTPADPAPLPLEESAAIDLNHALPATLCLLPGVGEKTAVAIVAYGAVHGGYSSLEEAENVKGVTKKMIAKWDGLAYVS